MTSPAPSLLDSIASLPADPAQTALLEHASGLAEGCPCEGELLTAVGRAMEARRRPGEPAVPSLSGMSIRREGLPDWWAAGANLLLAPPGVELRLSRGLGLLPGSLNVVLVGAGGRPPTLVLPGSHGLIAIGDRAWLPFVEARAFNGGATMIGEDTTARLFAQADSRNGASIIVGADGMWSTSVSLVTDDMHAIRDQQTGRRINGFGKRISVERHVWLCEQVAVLGGARIGADTVVGAQSLVKRELPPNSVCAGTPARPVRTGTTWTREDLP